MSEEERGAINFQIFNAIAPFKILLNAKPIYSTEVDVSEVEHVVEVDPPTIAGGHRIYLKVLAGKGLSKMQRYNLTTKGYSFRVGMTEANKISIEQLNDGKGKEAVRKATRLVTPRGNKAKSPSKALSPKPKPVEQKKSTPVEKKSAPVAQKSSNVDSETQAKIDKLASLKDKGIITEEEFMLKKSQLTGEPVSSKTEEKLAPVEEPKGESQLDNEVEQQIEKLRKLMEKGIISESEFDQKKRQLTGETEEKPVQEQGQEPEPEISQPKYKQNEQLKKLDTLLEKGILTQDEYETKKSQITGEPVPTKPVEQQQEEQQHEQVQEETHAPPKEDGPQLLTMFLTNLPASSDCPIKLFLDEFNHTMFASTDPIPLNKVVAVKGNVPKSQLSVTINVPSLSFEKKMNFDLASKGTFIQISQSVEKEGEVQIHQRLDDKFPDLSIGNSIGQPIGNSASGSKNISKEDIEYLQKLKTLNEQGILDQAEFEAKKKQVLAKYD